MQKQETQAPTWWRLTTEAIHPDYMSEEERSAGVQIADWSGYTWLVTATSPQDAMRQVILQIKESNAEEEDAARRWNDSHQDRFVPWIQPIPQVAWAAPMRGTAKAEQISGGSKYQSQAFDELWDFEAAEEVRL